MEKRLYEASLSGNVDTLNELMKEDPLILARVSVNCFDETPLHIAAMLGHVDFATALLSHMPDLVTELDSRGFSPLHLASVKGCAEIVKKLLLMNSDACLFRDEDGRTPLHLAVMKGRVNVITELVQARPEVIQYELDRGETLLHSSVKHNRLGALKLLVEIGRTDDDFINYKDKDGNTILHMATALKQVENIKYLLNNTGVKVNTVNGNGFTALDIIEHTPRGLKSMEIHEHLLNAGALRARNIPPSAPETNQVIRVSEITSVVVNLEAAAPPSDVHRRAKVARRPSRRSSIKEHLKKQEDWLEKKRAALMVAASVIATMAFEAGLNPPGGVWQENGDYESQNNETIHYHAGDSIFAYYKSHEYHTFWVCNTVSFVASLSIILLLISGLPLKRRIITWILMLAMWVTITFMALTYWTTMVAFTPLYMKDETICIAAERSFLIWLGLIGIVSLMHIVRFFIWSVQKVRELGKKWFSIFVTHQDKGNA